MRKRKCALSCVSQREQNRIKQKTKKAEQHRGGWLSNPNDIVLPWAEISFSILSLIFLLFSSLLTLQVAVCLWVSWVTSISRMDRSYATAALQWKEGKAYCISKIHRNTSLESICYWTTGPKTHPNTHILIFNPGETGLCYFSSQYVYALQCWIKSAIWFSGTSLTSPAAEALYQSTGS